MLAELSPDAILVERHGRCAYANRAAAKLLGAHEPGELLGRTIADLLEPAERERWRQRTQSVLTTWRSADRIESRWRRLDGTSVDVEVVAGPIEFEGAAAVEVVVRDVTERKRAEDLARASQEQRYRTLFESIDQGFCVIDVLFDEADVPVDYRFIEVNPAFELHTGITGAVGKRMRDIVPHHEAHWFQIYGEVARTGKPVRFQQAAMELGRFYDVYAFRIGDPAEARVAVLFQDIGERRRLENELRRAADELSEANRRKDDYLAMLGHELRNPLAAIRSAAELVRLTEIDDPRLRRARGVLERQSSHMARLIDGLLEVSRIARGKVHLHLSPLDLRELLEAVVQDRAAEITAPGLELETRLGEVPLWVSGDELRLVQVFDNILGNAMKFTAPPGTIAVSLSREGDRAVVSIRDTGIGIRPEMLARIFEAFQQETQDSARSAGGLGLGLALAKGLVELHHGSIHAASEGVGQGAEIVVSLPLSSAPAPRGEEVRPRPHHPSRVLLVEDNADAAEMLADLLRLSGHEVETAGSGRAGLEALARGGIDIVLCDLGLPGMSGLELARAVRRDASVAGVPLVALTGYGQLEDRSQSSEAGFDEHLVKPVDLETLNDVIGRLVRKP